MREAQISAGIAHRDLHEASWQVKALFVPGRFRGQGTGRLPCQRLLDTAADGYRLIRQDSGDQSAEARAMDESLGFHQCPAYHQCPAELMAHVPFLPESHRSKALGHGPRRLPGAFEGRGPCGLGGQRVAPERRRPRRATSPECAGGGQR